MQKLESTERERRAKSVIDSYSGIIPQSEAFYIHSILYTAGRSLDSFNRYTKMKDTDVSAENIVSILQEAVGHAAALSRYFWPTPGGKKNEPNQRKLKEVRGGKLRQAFCMNEESPLYSRDLRNAWEHFDERLDAYLLENVAGFFFPSCIVDNHQLADEPNGHIFKLLDPEAECLVLLGKKYFFTPICEEVNRIFLLANYANDNGSRLPSG